MTPTCYWALLKKKKVRSYFVQGLLSGVCILLCNRSMFELTCNHYKIFKEKQDIHVRNLTDVENKELFYSYLFYCLHHMIP